MDHLALTFARYKIQIIGSGGTAEALRKLGLTVQDVSEYTGFSEMPGGLVKTLHPKIHAGILGDWKDPAQKKYLEQNKVKAFDFVVVNLYPFEEAVRNDAENLKNALDNIDIGGVALIRAAAKGALLNKRVVPVTSPKRYRDVARDLEKDGLVSAGLRVALAQEAFALTAGYDAAIRDYLARSLE